jgi:hypothetical protein
LLLPIAALPSLWRPSQLCVSLHIQAGIGMVGVGLTDLSDAVAKCHLQQFAGTPLPSVCVRVIEFFRGHYLFVRGVCFMTCQIHVLHFVVFLVFAYS